MKHIRRITSEIPQRGNQWQELVCVLAVAINALLSFMGGEAPVFQFIEDKCDIPEPNSGT